MFLKMPSTTQLGSRGTLTSRYVNNEISLWSFYHLMYDLGARRKDDLACSTEGLERSDEEIGPCLSNLACF